MKRPTNLPLPVSTGTVLFLLAMSMRFSALLAKGSYSFLALEAFHFNRGNPFWPPFPYLMGKFALFSLPE